MRELTTERGTQVIINPEHVVTIRVRGTLKEVGDALGFGAAEGRAPSLSLA